MFFKWVSYNHTSCRILPAGRGLQNQPYHELNTVLRILFSAKTTFSISQYIHELVRYVKNIKANKNILKHISKIITPQGQDCCLWWSHLRCGPERETEIEKIFKIQVVESIPQCDKKTSNKRIGGIKTVCGPDYQWRDKSSSWGACPGCAATTDMLSLSHNGIQEDFINSLSDIFHNCIQDNHTNDKNQPGPRGRWQGQR